MSTASGNTLVGRLAGQGLTTSANSDYNTIIGFNAAGAGIGEFAVCIGASVGLQLSSFDESTLIGYGIGASGTIVNTVAVGYKALDVATGVTQSVVIGNSSGWKVTTGDDNVLLGCVAGGEITTGRGNTCLGHDAGGELVSGQYGIAIGYSVEFPSSTDNNQFVLGHKWIGARTIEKAAKLLLQAQAWVVMLLLEVVLLVLQAPQVMSVFKMEQTTPRKFFGTYLQSLPLPREQSQYQTTMLIFQVRGVLATIPIITTDKELMY
jgi:hypothetical protein